MSKKRGPEAAQLTGVREAGETVFLTTLYFFVVCLSSSATVKDTAMRVLIALLVCVFLFFGRLRDQIKPPICALALVVLMDGVSCFYAASGKYALREYLKILIAFCLALLLLSFAKGAGAAGRVAAILSGTTALAGLVSIDHLSTRLISTPVFTFLAWFTTDYANQGGVEEGVRIEGIFYSVNAFAACMGLGVLLSLGLAASAPEDRRRRAGIVCLFINSLAFLLTFSMGASAMIVPAFIVLLLLERRDRRAGLLFLMAETLIVTLAAAAVISRTSLTAWSGFRPVPLLCVIIGSAALCCLDHILGRRAAARLGEHNRTVPAVCAGALAAFTIFAAAACQLTGGVSLQAGEVLRRGAYPAPGEYTLVSEAEPALEATVRIETQNLQDAMMHTSTVLYNGPLSGAEFSVPEDSLVTYFYFRAAQPGRLESVKYAGDAGSGTVPLGYKLLPGFIANRLQGLFVNQNAIQRLAFARDGLKLASRSPLIGLGLGAFEAASMGVQSFYYFTKYPHNHYVQALLETGIVGLILFLGMFLVPAVCVLRGRKRPDAHPLLPALGAALVFMAGHAAVEVDFSIYAFLPMAYGVFALINLCFGDDFPLRCPAKKVQSGVLLGLTAFLAVFGVLLGCNIAARNLAHYDGASPDEIARAIALDRFEWSDYMLEYVSQASDPAADEETRRQADKYAERLAKVDANSVPLDLAEYYLNTGRTEPGLEMVEKYVRYTAANSRAWRNAFHLLEEYEQDTQLYRGNVRQLAELMEAWNRENMGEIVLDEQSAAFIARMTA